jgi:hypothetical protein
MILTCRSRMKRTQPKTEPNMCFDAAARHLRQAGIHFELSVGWVFVDHGGEQPTLAAVQRPQALVQRYDLIGAKGDPLSDVYLHVAEGEGGGRGGGGGKDREDSAQ